ncbi:MAG: hypothetical protein J6C01_00140, partial [Lachnospiraceae bacterium]|nr:hypothetical protein [Lachnospiraceae bacterium]
MMKKRIMGITIAFSVLILLVTGFFYVTNRPIRVEDENAKQIVALNEIEQLAKEGDLTAMSEKIANMQQELRKEDVVE